MMKTMPANASKCHLVVAITKKRPKNQENPSLIAFQKYGLKTSHQQAAGPSPAGCTDNTGLFGFSNLCPPPSGAKTIILLFPFFEIFHHFSV
jgi:hypothetical protein